MNQHLIIRVDATPAIGIGHMMRCIALAQAWADRGGEVTFYSHCEIDSLHRRILDEGFQFISLGRTHPNAAALKEILDFWEKVRDTSQAHWLVLDGYHFGTDYQEVVRRAGFRLLVIDDYNHQLFYHADILCNQNIGAERLHYNCNMDRVLLLGPKYVLLRKEFLAFVGRKREIPSTARNILVTLGGGDPGIVMLKVLKALRIAYIPELQVRIIARSVNSHIKDLEEEIEKDQKTALCFQIVRNGHMPEVMEWADLAISAGGSTCWELAFMGVPFLVIIVAENQEGIARGLGEGEIAINCGWSHALSPDGLAECLDKIIADAKSRADYSSKGRRLVDGLGTERVINRMAER